MNHRTRSSLALFLCAVGLAALTTGCGSTRAEPLEVTYYFLPG